MSKAQLSPATRQAKLHYAKDFAAYAEKFCRIRVKGGQFVPFKLNKVQRDLLKFMEDQLDRTGRIRVVVLKARQQGFSTFMQAYTYWYCSHRKAKKAFVVADKNQTSKTMLKMLTDTHQYMHPTFKPTTERASVRELYFGELNTVIEVGSAEQNALGRGNTLQACWLSELAYWPENTSADNLAGLLNCVPDEPGTFVVIESTAAGAAGPFYDMYQGAPANKFEQFFAPWFHTSEYRDDNLPEGWGRVGGPYELTIEEMELKRDFDLDDAQLWWRRQMIARDGRTKFMVDYPAVENDAFQNSGSPMFDLGALQHQRQIAEPMIETRTYDEDIDSFVEATGGELRIYHSPEKHEQYYIGADSCYGTANGDYATAVVMDADKRVVAIYRKRVNSRMFASALASLGVLYENAEICAEVDGPGYAMIQRLAHDLHYPYVWRRISDQKLQVENTDNLGFRTTAQTKPMVISRLQDDLLHNRVQLNDVTKEGLLDEMRIFIKFPGSVKLGAMPGKDNHDDLVMACALANYINDGRWEPIKVGDEFYTEAL